MKRALLVFAGLLTACGTDFRPESLVENMRLLGVRANPAELHPGETARIDALVLDPSRPGQATTVVWIGCDADPFNENRGACSDPAVLQDPSQLAGDPGSLPPGVHLIGLGTTAFYTVPPTLFDVLPAGDPGRITGTVGQVLSIAVAEEVSPTATKEELQALFDRVKNKEVRSLVTLFRVRVSENPERNANPQLSALLVAGERWPEGAHVQVMPSEKVMLDVEAPDSSYEAFTNYTPSGPEQATERLLAAWYSTSGRFSEDRTALLENVKTVFTAPGVAKDPVPDDRRGSFYTVVRDTRGGSVWREYPFYVCNDAFVDPVVSAVSFSSPNLVLEGTLLDAVLDVVVEGRALTGGYIAARNTWEGSAASLPSGAHDVTIFTRGGRRFVTAQPLVVP